MLIGYTLGNPEVYAPALRQGTVHKSPGGAWFPDLELARAALETSPLGHGLLPRAWFPDSPLPIPGEAYELHLPDDSKQSYVNVRTEPDAVGAWKLLIPAEVRGCSDRLSHG